MGGEGVQRPGKKLPYGSCRGGGQPPPPEEEGVKERPGPRGPGRRLARARAALGTVNIRRNGRHAGHPVGSCEEGGGWHGHLGEGYDDANYGTKD